MGCGILFPRDYRREWDDIDDAALVAVGRAEVLNGAADVDPELGVGDAGFSSSESEDEQWWERPNPDNGTKVQVPVAVFDNDSHKPGRPQTMTTNLVKFMQRC